MPEHVRVDREAQLSRFAHRLDHAEKASGREGRAPLASEHEGGLGLLLTSETTQRTKLVTSYRMDGVCAALEPPYVHVARVEVDLGPIKADQLARPKPIPVAHEEHARVPMAVPVLACGL